MSHGSGILEPIHRLIGIAVVLLPTVAALFVGLRAYFLPESRLHGDMFFKVIACGFTLIAIVFGFTDGWLFAGPLAIALMSLMAAVWLLYLWKQNRWWGQLVMAASMVLLPGALLFSVVNDMSLTEYRQLASYPTTFICISLITLILMRDAQLLKQELVVRREAEQALRVLAGSLEEQVAKRTENLQEVVAGLQSFAAMVSHDLRGPVRNVTGLAAMALEDIRQGDARGAEQALTRILRESQRGAAMVNDLLSLAHVEKAGVQSGEVDMAQTLHEAVEALDCSTPMRGRACPLATCPAWLQTRG